jgi:hypothetical protein
MAGGSHLYNGIIVWLLFHHQVAPVVGGGGTIDATQTLRGVLGCTNVTK